MNRTLIKLFAFVALMPLLSLRSAAGWKPLLDKNLSQWERYLSYMHQPGYNGKIPKSASGQPIAPIGYNKDSAHVFSVLDEPGGPVLRVSGAIYGCIFTKEVYENYHLKLQVKWGKDKFTPRKDKLRDTGILYHSNGEAGAEYWRTWMLSQEFQIMEGHMGDYWCQANSAIDIRAFQSEGVMSRVADHTQPFLTHRSGGDYFCMRSANYESPAGEWTTLELVCFEGKSLHIVNGHVVMVLQNSRYIQPDGQEVPMRKGRIQLQSEAAEAYFKNIQIRTISEMPSAYAALFN